MQNVQQKTIDWSELDRLVATGDITRAIGWCQRNGVPLEMAIAHVQQSRDAAGVPIDGGFAPAVGEVVLP
jgi:hypothetical protein